MKLIKRSAAEVPREDAHGGSGGRRLYLDKGQLSNTGVEAMTHGYLPAGNTFDWHDHKYVEEVMLVLKGSGQVSDREGDYEYAPGDLFIFPANIEHKIHNPSDEEHEMIFIRVHV
jgi:quercetin dioxygenase-like cupin family protein